MRYIILLFLLFNLSCSTKSASELKAEKIAEETDVQEKQRAQDLKDELFIGRSMASQLIGTYGIFNSKEASHYIQLVGSSLAYEFGRTDIKFYFSILDSEEVNAYATPGGYVFLTKGLLYSVKDESELASVIAHEIAHINEKHMYNDIKPKRDISVGENVTRLLSKGGSDITSSLSKAVDEGIKMLLVKGLEHKYEFEADQVGILLVSQLGYNPQSLISVLKRIKATQKNNHMSKTHPPFDARIAALDKLIVEQKLSPTLKADQKVLEERFKKAFTEIVL